jgi:hypothetical protein
MLIKSVNGHYIIIEIKGGNILVTCSLDNKVVQQITVDLFVSNKSWYTVYLKQVDRNLELTDVIAVAKNRRSVLLSGESCCTDTCKKVQ